MIAGILLAAGAGRRFGSDKLLHDLQGKPLVYRSLEPALDSQLPRVYVVHDPRSAALKAAIHRFLPDDKNITFVPNERPDRGMMSSLKCGLEALEESCDGAMVLLADMPGVTPELINTLLRRFEEENTVIIPECGGEWHHPRIIPARLFPEFLTLKDNESGMTVVERHRAEVLTVHIGEKMTFRDIDKPSDLDPPV
ncbi:MAG: nucleotidyltransferase family protein [Candidatus Krumholzibacteria bacterium]